MVAVDANVFLYLVNPAASAPIGPDGKPVPFVVERVAHLVETLEKGGVVVLIPAPALAEVLVRMDAEAAQRVLDTISKRSVFRVADFDTRAALEVAAMSRGLTGAKRKSASGSEVYAKLKYDRQILAIAKVHGAAELYTDDQSLRALCAQQAMPTIGVGELRVPPDRLQHEIPLAVDRP